MVLDELELVEWSRYHHAYGQAANLPELLRKVTSTDSEARTKAMSELWGTIWHQGTVYDCTPLVVPFLVELLSEPAIDTFTRAELAILLAEIACSGSFVDESTSPRTWPATWRTGRRLPAGTRDLSQECRESVATHADVLAGEFGRGPRIVRIGLLAVFAAIANGLPPNVVEDVKELSQTTDGPVAAAARLVVLLADELPITRDGLATLASADQNVRESFEWMDELPVHVQAVELARELSIAALRSG